MVGWRTELRSVTGVEEEEEREKEGEEEGGRC